MNDSSNFWGNAPVIFTYTRAQAIEDGVLVDLNSIAPEECRLYKFPIAVTSTVWALVEKAIENPTAANDLKGVVWDILNMARFPTTVLSEAERLYKVIITGTGEPDEQTLKMIVGPGDNGEPVITIMLPHED